MTKYERKAQSQPKHGPPSVSSASKAPMAPPSRRPELRGSGYTKKAVRHPSSPAQQAPAQQAPTYKAREQIIPESLQQLILDIFRETFPASNEFETLKPALREIRDDVARRDFQQAFGTEERMERYTIRWSPSQALAYSNILAWVCMECKDNEWVKRFHDDKKQSPSNVLSFGRGAADLVALIAVLKHVHSSAAGQPDQSLSANEEEASAGVGSLTISERQPTSDEIMLSVALADSANWTNVITKLHQSYTIPRPLSKYASAKARASNTSPLSPQALTWKFTQLDILESGLEDLRTMIGPDPALLPFFFTLGDLYLTSVPKTSALLVKLTAAAPKGSLLVVVDSPGACVETGTTDDNTEVEEKRYPMHLLMYRALLAGETQKVQKKKDEKKPAWEKLANDSHCLFELSKDLWYPVSLENIKYQVHVLQRL